MAASSPTLKNLSALIETPESGRYRVTKTGVVQTRIYGGSRAICTSSLLAYGTLGTGSQAGYYVSECDVTPKRGEQAELTVTWQSGTPDGGGSDPGLTLPPDEVGVSSDNLSPRIEKHPNYTSLAAISGELANVEDAARSQNKLVRAAAYNALSTAGKQLVDKIRKGNETYYLAALRYSWVQHSWATPIMIRGGYRESPLGPLGGYFVSDIDWLREGDDLQLSNGVWRLTRSWLGGPNGHWDTDIYAQ